MNEIYENGMTNKMNKKKKINKNIIHGDINNKIKTKIILHPSPQFHSMMCANFTKAGVNNNNSL